MKVSQTQIVEAIQAAFSARGISEVDPHLMQVDPPRPWGVTTNVCFRLAGRVAKAEIGLRTEGLSKKEAKQIASQVTKEVGEKLAEELASELNQEMAKAEAEGMAVGPLPLIDRVEAEGAYVNFYYDTRALTQYVVATAVREGAQYGKAPRTRQRIMVEYAQPNTHKDFHVGHLRNASIGQAIANLQEFAGKEVLKATYIGDVGAHVKGACIVYLNRELLSSMGYRYYFEHNLPDRSIDPLGFWGYLYTGKKLMDSIRRPSEEELLKLPEEERYLAQQIKSELEKIDELSGEFLLKWEAEDPKIRELVSLGVSESVRGFKAIFAELKLSFTTDPDCWFYESTVDDTKLGQQTAAELKARGIAVVDESEEYKGALYVDFAEQADALKDDGTPVFRDDEKKHIRKLGKMTILRSDGTSLYQTKELGLAKHKFDLVREKFGTELTESLYVVGAEQNLYFNQVFAILRLWGFPNAENCKHISYELVVLPEGKMSSREGNIVSYRELRDEAIERARTIAREKGIGSRGEGGEIDEAKVDSIARDVAIAAIKFAMLKVTGGQQIVFDFEDALSFSGRAAPYLQYAYARGRKLISANSPELPSMPPNGSGSQANRSAPAARNLPPTELSYAPHNSEVELARYLSVFPSVCEDAAANHEPATLCTYLYELATVFNDFYRDCPVLKAEEAERSFRQTLTRAFLVVMETGFKLLALPLPEEM